METREINFRRISVLGANRAAGFGKSGTVVLIAIAAIA
jgi:hypothetical protein